MGQSVLLAFGVPIIFILVGAIGRKLVRGTDWERRDFYLGVELCLAALSSNILFLIELLRASAMTTATPDYKGEVSAALFLVVVFSIYMWLLSLHQDWESKGDRPTAQMCRLMLLSNALGGGLFAAFVFLIKGVR
jgi:hypothetical protein